MEEIRYDLTDAEKEAQKITELAGENASSQEIDTAEVIVNEDRWNPRSDQERRELIEFHDKGYIYVEPKRPYHTLKIGINAKDPEIFRLFNAAAREVLAPKGAFHQVGAAEKKGPTAWEMLGSEVSAEEAHRLAEDIYNKMLEYEVRWKNIGLL